MAQSRWRTSDILYAVHITLCHLLSHTNCGPSSLHPDTQEAGSNYPVPIPSDLCERREILLTRCRRVPQALCLLRPLVRRWGHVCCRRSLGELVDRWNAIRAVEC
jgi:hypothetical protein